MGIVRADIELVNPTDLAMVDQGMMQEAQVRKLMTSALVDTGAYMLCINEEIKEKLGLRHMSYENAELADGSLVQAEVVGPVIINFKNRNTACRAMVLPGNNEPLLGVIPMEDMDVVIVPLKQTIDVNPDHPGVAQKILKNISKRNTQVK
jgi:clan AA aspartic protease